MAGLFWKMAGLSTTSPIESILDKSVYTLEELLDEDQIIQECKSTNHRLVNFLRGKPQVKQMIHYVIEEPPEGADSKRAFKFPFISCQIITCELEPILKTLGEDKELLSLLFSFLDPGWKHGTLLAGYFSKVVICLLIREHDAVMKYLQAHEDLLRRLVDLIGITSIKEVLMRLVDAGDHGYAYLHADSLQWLAGTNLLEMLVDKLSPQNPSEVHANAAEVLAAISRTFPSELASKLASPSFVSKLFQQALEDPESKSALIHSLSVCISLLPSVGTNRSHAQADTLSVASPETVDGMVQNLENLLRLLDVSQDTKVLPTTYGELRPPFGIHRLKIVEFVAVLLRTHSEAVRQELIRLEGLQTLLNSFFNYPYNNMLHNHVEAIITSCMDSAALTDILFQDCDFLSRLLATDANPYAPDTRSESTVVIKKPPPKVGNLGHLTRIANRLVQCATTNQRVQNYLQSHVAWSQWQSTVLQQRNIVDNVYQWTCGRPTSIRDRPVESDDEEFRERDYDVSTMASNLRYGIFDTDDTEEVPGTVDREEEDVFFDDETAEVVISSIRLSDEQERFGETPPAWFAFQDEAENLQADNNVGTRSLNARFRDEEAVGEEGNALPDNTNGRSIWSSRSEGITSSSASDGVTDNAPFNLDYFSKDWANFQAFDISDDAIKREEFGENNPFIHALQATTDPKPEVSSKESENVQGEEGLAGIESEATAKAMESALKEGIVGEAGPLKPKPLHAEGIHDPGAEDKPADPEFNDVNYWRSEYETTVGGEQ